MIFSVTEVQRDVEYRITFYAQGNAVSLNV